ncbi:MAG: NAD(+) diphosphatase [Bacteroides sp.]
MNNNTKAVCWFVFCQDKLLLAKQNGGCAVPCQPSAPTALSETTTVHEVTTLNGRLCKAYFIDQPIEETDDWVMTGLRASYDSIPLEQYEAAGKAFEILHWDRSNRYCAACGTPLEQKDAIMKKCPVCGNEVYPAISTAVLVLIRKGDAVLLVHARNFRGTFYGLVAGFLETGETLEECVRREVTEETGLEIKNIAYFGNQPWPYPSGLMVGFIADYAGGDIKLQEEELSAGAFYTRAQLPEIPGKLSLARKMIDWWITNA